MKRRLIVTTVVLASTFVFGENPGHAAQTTSNQMVRTVMDGSRNTARVFIEEFTGIN